MSDSKFLVVLGIGNTVRRDDGAGIRVVEQLKIDPSLKHLNIAFKFLNTGGFDILDEIDGYARAIIVDAADMPERLKPGEILYLRDLEEMAIGRATGVSSHGIGVIEVLKYAIMGGYDAPKAIEIYGVQVKETDLFSEELSPEVAKGVEKLTRHLKQYILSLFADRE
ncbi:MAG: hydrogenase maturation protease [Candidatus Hermodarchaeota archaeon]